MRSARSSLDGPARKRWPRPRRSNCLDLERRLTRSRLRKGVGPTSLLVSIHGMRTGRPFATPSLGRKSRREHMLMLWPMLLTIALPRVLVAEASKNGQMHAREGAVKGGRAFWLAGVRWVRMIHPAAKSEDDRLGEGETCVQHPPSIQTKSHTLPPALHHPPLKGCIQFAPSLSVHLHSSNTPYAHPFHTQTLPMHPSHLPTLDLATALTRPSIDAPTRVEAHV
mmetsp:Transcript_15994/g.34733  ORF Transcript_15994/g.34733 Transcript_15994/m.34733 type:complete len:224 (-) Transcript_15994:40-711(-)